MTNPGSEESHRGTPDVLIQAAIEACPVGLAVVATGGSIVLSNPELERLFGYSAPELLGMTLEVLVPDLSAAAYADLRGDVLPAASGRRVRDVLGRRKDGSELPAQVTLTALRVDGVVMILASIVERSDHRQDASDDAGLQERLALEALTAEFGPEFVNVPSEDVDRRIDAAVGQIGRTLDVDQVTVMRIIEERGELEPMHQWARPGTAMPRRRIAARDELPWHLTHLTAGEVVSFAQVEDIPHPADRDFLLRETTKSGVAIPVRVGSRIWGALTVTTSRRPRDWTPMLLGRLGVLSAIVGAALARRDVDEQVRRTMAELRGSRERLRDETAFLRAEAEATGAPAAIVAHSAPMRRAMEQARHAALTQVPVLFVGQPGTGRSTLARHLHAISPRHHGTLIRAAASGATMAMMERRLTLAEQSTVFVDEVADLPADVQALLVRVLAERDVRFLGATRTDLGRRVADGSFRDDLYRRLAPSTIAMSPLRERPEDVAPLVWRFVDEFAAAYGRPIDVIDRDAMTMLQRYPWPGNARELRAVIERAMVVGTGRHLHIEPLSTPRPPRATTRGRRR